MWRLGFSAAVLASACQYDRPADIMPVDARELDAVDAPPPCTPSTTVCDDVAGVYTECDADGAVVRQLTCPLGCATDTEQCLDIDPHNGLAMYLDMVASPPDVVLTGPATIDPMSGLVFDGGASVAVPTFVSTDGIRVFVVNSLTVEGALSVAPSSNLSHPIAVVSRANILIRGVIDVSASRDLAGPGGWPGTDPQHSQSNNCIGRPLFTGAPSPGGGGGGGAVAGAAGGSINMVAGGIPGVAKPAGPLTGGCAGGAILATGDAYGGGGGGGLQLASRTEIRIESNGAIDASGGGGAPGGLNLGGTGGGAGGDVVLEAPQVVLTGSSVVVSTKGGGGGGASSGSTLAGFGGDGGTTAPPAAGGTSPIGNLGGSGGGDAPPVGGADAVGGGQSGGGGGGAAGTVVTATSAGVLMPANGAAIRGRRQDEALRTRRIP